MTRKPENYSRFDAGKQEIFSVLVRSGWCDSLAGGQPEHAYTDGVGGMAAGWLESHRQKLRANAGRKNFRWIHAALSMPRSKKAEFLIR